MSMLMDKTEVFWGEIAPCDHLLQIYENDTEYLSALSRFVSDGFKKNESVVIIATAEPIVTRPNSQKTLCSVQSPSRGRS